jgi:hypothetical protein
MNSWLRGVTFGVVFCIVFGAVALLQAGGKQGEDRVGKLEQAVRDLSRRVEYLEKCVSEPPRTAYAGIGKTSALRTIQQVGGRLSLQNGSAWSIAQQDRAMVLKWRMDDQITVETSRNREFPYALINERLSEVAEAQYLGNFKL